MCVPRWVWSSPRRAIPMMCARAMSSRGLDKADQLPGKLFHAGTMQRDGKVVTSGGRVFCAVGLGKTVAAAQGEAYALVDAVDFDGAQARLDIGYRAIARERRR